VEADACVVGVGSKELVLLGRDGAQDLQEAAQTWDEVIMRKKPRKRFDERIQEKAVGRKEIEKRIL
jgi:hypothetical protein